MNILNKVGVRKPKSQSNMKSVAYTGHLTLQGMEFARKMSYEFFPLLTYVDECSEMTI